MSALVVSGRRKRETTGWWRRLRGCSLAADQSDGDDGQEIKIPRESCDSREHEGCQRLPAGACRLSAFGSGDAPADGHSLVVYGTIVSLFSTMLTAGADQAARPASSFSAQDRTLPVNVTRPPVASTLIRRASSSAERRKAASILSLTSVFDAVGSIVIRFDTPLTPRAACTITSVGILRNLHSTVPSRVTCPLRTESFTC